MKTEEVLKLPDKKVPITTEDQVREEIPNIIEKSVAAIANDKFHNLTASKNGSALVQCATALLGSDLSNICAIVLMYLSTFFVCFGQNNNTNELLTNVGQVRRSQTFLVRMKESVLSIIQLDDKHIKQFIQRLLTQLITQYFKRQNELMVNQEKEDAATVTNKDKQVIYYICGYVIHTLRKRYLKLKSNKAELLQCLDKLVSSNDSELSSSSWTDKMNRGGLKKPRRELFGIFVQIERWIRDIVSTQSLTTDSLVNLKVTLMDYSLLRRSWENLFPNSSIAELTVLEHSIELFLKVRGFAVTKLVRRKLLLEQKKSKAKAGSKRKALRKELKELKAMK